MATSNRHDPTMRMLTPNLARVVLTVSSLVLAVPAQGKIQDVVLLKDGKRLRGVEVVEMTVDTVKYKRGDQELDLPANTLVGVRWSDPPEAFALALSAVRRGDFATAAEQYGNAARDAKREPLKLEARYLAAEAMLRVAGSDALKARQAVDALQSFLNDLPTHYRVPDAMLELGKAQRLSGDAAAASQTLRRLADDSLAKNWSPVWDARAKLELARALMVQGDFGNARATFRSAVSAADLAAGGRHDAELTNLKAKAQVGEGTTFVRENKFDDALRFFANLAKAAETEETRAAARAGEGEALFLRAEAAGNTTGLRAAQVALADANLLDVAAADTTAKALYYTGRVILALGPDREGSGFKERAMDYFTTVATSYSDTEWAARAREELKR